MARQVLRLPPIVRRYRVAASLLSGTAEALRTTGQGTREAVVLWQGRVVPPDAAEATKLIIPAQLTGPRHFNVPLDERMRIADDASRAGELIIAQLHTHPREAFHSRADNELAIIKHIGAFSIVVPDFGMRWLGDLQHTAIFIHLGQAEWRQLSPSEIDGLFEVLQ